jgi:trimeric autotransporter adhesin
VTITGTGFNGSAGGNIVYFGATAGSVTSASATSLTVTIPVSATYMPVSVENTACALTGFGHYPFMPVYNNSAFASGTVNFDPVVTFGSGTNPYCVAIGDLDGDGKADLAVTNIGSNTVSVFRNTSTSGSISGSSFASKVDFSTGMQPYCVAISDLDGDGKPDLAIANQASNTVSILRNTSAAGSLTSGSFASKVDFTTGTNPMAVAVADLDLDGKPDLVTSNFYSNTISVFRSTATYGAITSGSFAAKVDFATGTHPYNIALGDINGDRKPEIVVPNQGSNTVSVFHNNTTPGVINSGSFLPRVDFITGSQPVSVALCDLDGDGLLDMAVPNTISRTISVFRNTVTGGAISSTSFAAKVDITAGVLPYSISVADIDGDGKADMIVTHEGNTRAGTTAVSIFRNTATSGSISSSSFAAKVDVVTASSPRYVAVGDLDGDARPDIAVALVGDNTVAVLRYNSIQPITGATFICGTGSTITLSDITTGGAWSSSNTAIATVGTGTGVVTGVGTGTAIITYALSGGDFVTTTVTATAGPSAISGATSVCIGSSVTLTNATSGGTWSSSSAIVASVGSVSGVVNGIASGTSVITYSLGAGCNATATVTVNPTAISGASAVCVGLTAALTDVGGGTWSSSNTAIADVGTATGIVSGISSGTAIISYSISGCIATSTFSVIAAPGAISGTNATCIGAITTLVDGGSGTWTSSNTSVATVGAATGIVAGVSTGTSIISYSLGTSCIATATVTINAMPGAISGTTSLCPLLSTTLTDATAAGTWSSSNTVVATVDASGIVTGIAAGTTAITYATGGSGCAAVAAITVNAAPSSIGGASSLCAGSTITLTNSVSGGTWSSGTTGVATIGSGTGVLTGVSAGTTVVTYTIGGGCIALATVTVNALPAPITGTAGLCIGSSTALNDSGGGDWASSNIGVALVGSTSGLVTGASAGTATISYTLSTGCLAITDVTVYALPSAISGTASVCAGSAISMTDAGGGTWSSSDASVASVGSATGVVAGISAGTAVISYTLSTGCAATSAVTVNPPPGTITGTTSVCVGSLSSLGNSVAGGTWSSSATSVATIDAASGILSGVTSGTSVITYTLSTGCLSTAVVTVNSLPPAISGGSSVCIGSALSLTDVGAGSWSSSDAAIAAVGSSTGSVTGIASGTATITYTLATGCTATNIISVNSLPAATSGAGSICAGSTTAYSDITAGGIWSSSATGVATVDAVTGSVSGVSAGVATISYTLGTGCAATSVVTINPLPSAIAGTLVVCEAAGMSLTDAGGGTWNSSNSTTAIIGTATGTVTGVTAGTTIISYTLPTGCVTFSTMTVNPVPSGITGSSAVCVSSSVTLSDGFAGGAWSSSDTTIATIGSASGVVAGVSAGTSVITYALSSGCSAIATISVNALPSAITGSNYVCSGLTTALNDAIPGGTWTSSNTAVATVGSSNGIVTGVSTGTAGITYALSCGTVTTVITVGGVAAGPPAVTSVSPMVGYPASSVTITGTNFNTVTTNNTVYFGATQATVTSATTTSLTVTVPTGATYMPVSVNNNGCNLTGYSSYPFMPSYNNSAYVGGIVNFAAKVDFSSGANPYSVAIGDLDGDGKADLAVANLSANTVSVFRNTSTSGSLTSASFASRVDFTTGNSPYSIAIADVDGDDKLDMVVANEVSNTVSILRNTAASGSITSSSFAAKVDFPTGTNPISVAVADMDADGKPDVVVANFYSNTISIIRNTVTFGITSSSFAPKVDFAAGTHPYSVAVGDIDGDNQQDIVTANQGSASVSIFRNTAATGSITTASLAAKVDFATGSNPYYVALGDVDGDGKLDIAAVNNASNTLSIFRNTAASGAITSGSLAARVDFATGVAPYNVSMGDINGDGKVDLAVANSSSNTVSIFRNTASSGSITTGSLAGKVDFATGTSPRFVALGDLDGDGLPDLSVANLSANTMSVIRNNPLSSNAGVTTLCAGGASTLTNTVAGGVWSSSNTAVATVVSGTGVVTGVSTGTAVISYTIPGGSAVTTVTVNTAPSAVSGTSIVCAGSSATLTDATGGGTWSSGNTSIATINSDTGVLTGVSAGTATITYAMSASCTVTKIATVNPLPGAIAGSSNVCTGAIVTLRSTTAGGTWSCSNPSAAAIGSGTGAVSGIAAGTTVITYTLGTGCSATAVTSVIASPASVSGATGVCVGSATTLTDATSGGAWSSSNMGVATIGSATGIVSGVATGTSIVTYTSASGCTATATVTVNTVPAAISGSSSVCAGSVISLSDATSGGTWSSSAASVATVGSSGIVSGVAAGTAEITYSVGSVCAVTATVTVSGVPTISSLSASAGFPGSAVTISGANFSATAANNIVYFGATKATVSMATATSLTVTVPVSATYMPVSVDNTGCNLTAYSQYPYLPTWDNSAYVSASINFSAKVDFSASTSPFGIAIGDIDGDGLADMVCANQGSNTVSVFRNTSTSGAISSASFAAKVDFTTGTSPYSVAIGDLDGDGKLDLAVANNSSNTVSVLRNTAASGTITASSFAAKVDFVTGTNPMNIAIGDIDGDGKPEMISSNFYANTISVLRNTATAGSVTTSSFAAKVDFATGTHPYCVALGDIDGDGKRDIVTSNQAAPSISVFRNTATTGVINGSSLAAKVDFTTASNPYCVAIGDIDGDGKMDIVLINNGANSISVFRNTAGSGSITSGSLAAKVDFTTGASPYFVALGDIDGDGKVDIIVPNANANTVSVFRNTASSGTVTSGSLASRVDFATGTSPRSVAVADLDGDGMPDLAVAALTANKVSVLRNAAVHLAPHNSTTTNATVTLCAGAMVALNNPAAGGEWSSSNSSVATVDPGTGIVTAISQGRAAVVYNTASATYITNIIVNPLPDAVVITAYPGTGIQPGQNVILSAAVQNGGTSPLYQWQINGVAIPGATAATYENSGYANGDVVTCVVRSSTGCDGYSILASMTMNVRTVANNEVLTTATDIRIFPNPNNGTFTIKGSLGASVDEQVTAEVVNMLGQVVYNHGMAARSGNVDGHITLGNNLANGMYVLTIHVGADTRVFHIMLEK